jgi:hypothetical protein
MKCWSCEVHQPMSKWLLRSQWNDMKQSMHNCLNEPINQRITESLNHWINESMNQSMNQWRWINEAVNQWIKESTNQWMNEWHDMTWHEWMNDGWVDGWISELRSLLSYFSLSYLLAEAPVLPATSSLSYLFCGASATQVFSSRSQCNAFCNLQLQFRIV